MAELELDYDELWGDGSAGRVAVGGVDVVVAGALGDAGFTEFGNEVWPGGKVLGEWLAARPELVRGKAVLEPVGGVSVGAVSRADVDVARATGAPIFAWSVGVLGGDVRELARRHDVDVRRHDVIYHLVDDVARHLASKLPPRVTTEAVARADVARLFALSSGDVVAGCRVTAGDFEQAISDVRASSLELERRSMAAIDADEDVED